jgi:Flp pilus assembly pilin Flp
MKEILHSIWRNDEAQDLAEYAILLSLILLFSVIMLTNVANDVTGVFGRADTQLKTVP